MTRDLLAQRIRELRTNAGLTQKDAARHAGVSTQAWTAWEGKEHQPHAYRLGAIANAIGAPVAALFTPEGTHALADVIVTDAALERVATNGSPEAAALTTRIATSLLPVITAAADQHMASKQPRRRTRRARRLASQRLRPPLDASNTHSEHTETA